MKKRLISLFVALTMLLCLIPAAFAATFNAGTYTASANGMNGAVTVEVTFSDSAITDVKVTEQAETPAIASGALEQIPADIVAHQTLAVDTVTGATITSKAILAAVEDCVKQAGADPDTLRTPVEKNTADVGDRTAHVEVLVIGGGDTGNDCVGTAIRQGCESIMQLEMMPCPPAARAPGNDWPEWPRVLKTDYGQQEAIAKFGFDPRVYQTTVKEFYKNEAGQVCGALISKLKSEVVDGRRQMVPTGEEFTVDCDLVLIAAGFTGCEPYVADAFGVERTKRGTVADVKYATADPKVFACGDMRRGQSLVVWALREGRDTAAVVDEKLMGYTNL